MGDESSDYVGIRNRCPAGPYGAYQSFVQYEQSVGRIQPTGGPVDGGTLVTIAGDGFDAFGSVPHALSWTEEGGASSSHQIVSRCRIGELAAPVLDMTGTHAVCAAPAQPAGVVPVALALNGGSSDSDHAGALPFTFYVVTVASVLPAAGPTGGGQASQGDGAVSRAPLL